MKLSWGKGSTIFSNDFFFWVNATKSPNAKCSILDVILLMVKLQLVKNVSQNYFLALNVVLGYKSKYTLFKNFTVFTVQTNKQAVFVNRSYYFNIRLILFIYLFRFFLLLDFLASWSVLVEHTDLLHLPFIIAEV